MTTLDWNAATGRLLFETDALRGVVVADGQQLVIADVTCKPGGVRVDSGMMLAPYRLLARGAWMGEARAMPHRAERTAAGIDIVWEPSLQHQATLRLGITFPEPNAIDVTIDVTGHALYRDYEVFMSSYFREGFRSGAYLAPVVGEAADRVVQVRPEANPLFREMYLAFPRDERAANIVTDGRWQRGRHHTRFLPARYYGLPVGFYGQRDGPLDVLFMGPPEDVFAVNMAYATEDPDDHVGQHNSLYLSLFGKDLHPGERWQTRVRLAFGDFDRDPALHQKEYDRFLAGHAPVRGLDVS